MVMKYIGPASFVSYLFIYQPFFSFIILDGYRLRNSSSCFQVKGVPKVKLGCPGRSLIRVQQAFYGVPPTNKTCWYDSTQNQCTQNADDIQLNCNGRYSCSVYVSNPLLPRCITYASYLQINYTCIPRKYEFIFLINLSLVSL